MVFDGPPERLTADMLTRIYGAEDWEAAAPGRAEPGPAAVLDPDRIAGER